MSENNRNSIVLSAGIPSVKQNTNIVGAMANSFDVCVHSFQPPLTNLNK